MVKYLIDLDLEGLYTTNEFNLLSALEKGYFKVIELILNNQAITDNEWKSKVKKYLLKNMSTIIIPVAQVRKVKRILEQNKW